VYYWWITFLRLSSILDIALDANLTPKVPSVSWGTLDNLGMFLWSQFLPPFLKINQGRKTNKISRNIVLKIFNPCLRVKVSLLEAQNSQKHTIIKNLGKKFRFCF